MPSLVTQMLKCYLIAKHVDHYYWMHTPTKDGEKINIENIQKKGSPRASTSQAETSEDLGDDLRWAFGFGEVGMSGAPVVRQDDPYRLHGVMRAILEDHSAIQYIAGPALCESLSNVEGAIFSVVPLREPLPEAQ